MYNNKYELREFEKLQLVIKAALQNPSRQGVRLSTEGSDPAVAMTIEAYVLEKFLKATVSK